MNRRKILSRLACSVAAVVVLAAQSRAGALKPSDLVVSWAGYPSSFVQEYTPSGTLVQSWTITSHFSGENARDVGVDNSGDIVIYNGTFSPSLTILNPVTGGKTNYSFSGWNTVADVRWGTLAVLGKFAYATDDEIGTDAGGQNGIVRFNLANGSAQRFFSGIDTTSIGIGLNNKLYAVFPDTSPGQNQVVVIDTATMAQEKTFTAPVTLTGITADAAGNIYATSGTTLYKLDANGNILGSLNASWALDNIKISPTGQLIMDNNGGQIVMSSTKLSSSNEFTLNEPNAQLYESYAAFATPLPEPVSGLTCLVMAGALMRRPCRRAN